MVTTLEEKELIDLKTLHITIMDLFRSSNISKDENKISKAWKLLKLLWNIIKLTSIILVYMDSIDFKSLLYEFSYFFMFSKQVFGLDIWKTVIKEYHKIAIIHNICITSENVYIYNRMSGLEIDFSVLDKDNTNIKTFFGFDYKDKIHFSINSMDVVVSTDKKESISFSHIYGETNTIDHKEMVSFIEKTITTMIRKLVADFLWKVFCLNGDLYYGKK